MYNLIQKVINFNYNTQQQMTDIHDQLSLIPSNSLNIIYADPPWKYQQTVKNGVLRRKDGSIIYPSMTITQLCSLGPEIQRISRTDSALFLWATMPLLPEAFRLIESWGYKYKTCFVNWIKTTKDGTRPSFGVGYYTRSNAELCLVSIRGKIASYKRLLPNETERGASKMSSILHEEDSTVGTNFLNHLEQSPTPILMTKRREHSRKPPIVREMITRLLGDLPRIELFAREQTEGWGALGNDINHFQKIEHQQNLSEMKHERAHKKMQIGRAHV